MLIHTIPGSNGTVIFNEKGCCALALKAMVSTATKNKKAIFFISLPP
jgi:hypothetical protein